VSSKNVQGRDKYIASAIVIFFQQKNNKSQLQRTTIGYKFIIIERHHSRNIYLDFVLDFVHLREQGKEVIDRHEKNYYSNSSHVPSSH
jgi:hypothetical protein